MVINTSVSTYKHRLNSINLNKIQNIYSHNTCKTCFKYFKSTHLFKYLCSNTLQGRVQPLINCGLSTWRRTATNLLVSRQFEWKPVFSARRRSYFYQLKSLSIKTNQTEHVTRHWYSRCSVHCTYALWDEKKAKQQSNTINNTLLRSPEDDDNN